MEDARHRVDKRILAVLLIAGAVSALALATNSPAQIRFANRSYLPTMTGPHSFVFRPTARANEQIVDAWLVIPRALSRGGPLQRDVNLRNVQEAAENDAPLRVMKLPETKSGRLMITVKQTGNFPDPPDCAVDPATMTAPGCRVLRRDTAGAPDPRPGLWGTIDCESSSRYAYHTSGGDPSPTPTGVPQGDDDYRSLTAFDGDQVFGERCELGRNSHTYGQNTGGETAGTFALYREGDHRVTFFSERYPAAFPVGAADWQTVAQIKQAQPADNGGGSPAITLALWGNHLRLMNTSNQVWATRAPQSGTWIRYALDVVFSPDPAVGSVKVYVDLNGDGDALDQGEQSRRLALATQITETDGPNGFADGLGPGAPIPNHLRLGIYHHPSIACPGPTGCPMDIDNVQVVAP
jgi:hypothetical protein